MGFVHIAAGECQHNFEQIKKRLSNWSEGVGIVSIPEGLVRDRLEKEGNVFYDTGLVDYTVGGKIDMYYSVFRMT